MRVKLGTGNDGAKRLLKRAENCAMMGRRTAEVGCALAFAEYELSELRLSASGQIDPKDLSAGIHTAALSAGLLATWLEDNPAAREKAQAFRKAAESLNNAVRQRHIKPSAPRGTLVAPPAAPVTEDDVKRLRGRLKKLRGKVDEIWKFVDGECMAGKKPAAAVAGRKRR
jgi:hypothetical protein